MGWRQEEGSKRKHGVLRLKRAEKEWKMKPTSVRYDNTENLWNVVKKKKEVHRRI